MIWNKFSLKSRFLCWFQGADFAEAYKKCSRSSTRRTQEVTGRNLPSSGKLRVLDFCLRVIEFYLNEPLGSLFSICKIKEGSMNFQFSESNSDQWPKFLHPGCKNVETGLSPVQSSSVCSSILHVKWVKHIKQSFHSPPLPGDHQGVLLPGLKQSLLLWVRFLKTWIQVSIGNVFLLLKKET